MLADVAFCRIIGFLETGSWLDRCLHAFCNTGPFLTVVGRTERDGRDHCVSCHWGGLASTRECEHLAGWHPRWRKVRPQQGWGERPRGRYALGKNAGGPLNVQKQLGRKRTKSSVVAGCEEDLGGRGRWQRRAQRAHQ